MNYLKYSIWLLSILFLACSNSSPSDNKAKTPSKSSASCLEQYFETPCNILTGNQVIAACGFDASKIQLKNPIKNKVAKRTQCVYMWTSGRIEMVDTGIGTTIESKLNDKIDIGHFRKYDGSNGMSEEDWFKSSYPVLTSEQLVDREKRYKERLAKGEKDMVEEATIDLYKKLDRQPLLGLGDRGLIDMYGKMSSVTIVVMDKGISFQVSADISKDRKDNVEAAKSVAKAMLDICK